MKVTPAVLSCLGVSLLPETSVDGPKAIKKTIRWNQSRLLKKSKKKSEKKERQKK